MNEDCGKVNNLDLNLETSRTLFLVPERVTDRPFWAGHVPFAMWLVEQQKPGLVVELGTETGVSLAAFSQAVAALDLVCDIHGIDSWEGDSHTGYYAGVYEDFMKYLSEKGYGFTHLHKMLFDEAIALFRDSSIDILHIDGCHTYEAVRHDFESWKPKLSSRAVVLFHDTEVKKAGFGVWRFWREIREKYLSFEFKHSNGLGVALMGEERPSWFRSITVEDPDHEFTLKSFPRGIFEALGSRAHEASHSFLLRGALEKVQGQNNALENALAKAEALIVEQQQEWHAVDTQNKALHQALAEADDLLIKRQQEWLSLDAQTKALHDALAEADALLTTRQQQWHALDQALGVAEAVSLDRLRQVETLRGEQRDLLATIAQRDAELAALRNSTSWRLTAPLRAVVALVLGR